MRSTQQTNQNDSAVEGHAPGTRRNWADGARGKLVAAVMLLGVILGATAIRADAYLGQSVSIPGLHGCASGSGSLTSMSNGTAKGTIRLSTSCSGRKYYVQIKLAMAAAPDFADWQKVGAEIDGTGSRTFAWSDSYHGVYNGVKFRICQHKALSTDPCASPSGTIKK